MPKKTKKQVRKAPSMAPVTSATSGASTSSTPTVQMIAGRPSSADFNPDYSETLKDLKRIGIMAGSFVIILVILSFFLH